MSVLNLKSLDPAELAPLPEVPESFGPRNEEDERVLALVKQGLSSGQAIPVDDAFFAELDAIIAKH
ncbi:MAG: hypothetical protein JO269_12335 [Burkholderiaceae bacterium]|nr:hypothetical protein [Burkholderiaceae bacterium]